MQEDKELFDYEIAALRILLYEFATTDADETDKKIKRKLQRAKLGKFQAEKIAVLRTFKNAVSDEIKKFDRSEFYTHRHGEFADFADFDMEQMTIHFAAEFPDISTVAVSEFIGHAVHIYYLR